VDYETPVGCAQAEIRTRVVVICGPMSTCACMNTLIGMRILFHSLITVPTITRWPDLVRTYRGEQATLTWTLSEPVSLSPYVIEFLYERPPELLIGSWSANTSKANYGPRYNYSNSKIDIQMGSRDINLLLFHVEPDDAKFNYKCKISIGFENTTNSMAWIILYGTYESK